MTGPAGFNRWHTGSLPWTFTLLVRLASGTSWAALFNQRRQKRACRMTRSTPPSTARRGQ
jgi:hypothetical protein